mgnify:CR=1 FL=1
MDLASFFFFNDTSPTEIYTLSLHDALPIYDNTSPFTTAFTVSIDARGGGVTTGISAHDRATTILTAVADDAKPEDLTDRKSTRLNSSHTVISYAVFCLKKKKKTKKNHLNTLLNTLNTTSLNLNEKNIHKKNH